MTPDVQSVAVTGRRRNSGTITDIDLFENVNRGESADRAFQIFISHSRKDSEGRNFFQRLFSQSNTSGFWYSERGFSPPHSERIINIMRNCSSLFVVMSPEMENSHTSAWISFEVGVAKAMGKNVWVFEDAQNIAKDIVVPGANAYVQRPQVLEHVDSYGFLKIIDQGGLIVPKRVIRPENGKIVFDTSDNPLDPDKFYSRWATCGYENCRHSYFRALLKGVKQYRCPACRTPRILFGPTRRDSKTQ